MNKSSSIHTRPRTTAETRCELAGRLLALFQHEDGRTHREQQCSRKKNAGNRDVLLGMLGNPWSSQDGRLEVDPNLAAPARHIPMVNPEVEAGLRVIKTQKRRESQMHLHHEEDGV